MSGDSQTPMMKQYHAIRRGLPPKTMLLFRLGDFYEMFGEDAREASGILNVALTKRGEIPMCGVPFHSARGYIEKLIAAGWRAAICDQVGEVQAGKLVRREVSQILSAGTLDDFGLDDRRPNYLAAIHRHGASFGLAFCELTTGEFRLTEVPELQVLTDELARVLPAEMIAPEEQRDLFAGLENANFLDGYIFQPLLAEELLREHFKVHSLKGFGCDDLPAAVGAAGALLHYLTRQMRRNVSHLRRLQPYRSSEFLILDAATQGHLEIVQSRGGKTGTLLAALDCTVTPMGARLLRDWVLHPLRNLDEIHSRQEAISRLLEDPLLLGALREHLAEIRDLERAVSRLNGSAGNARDLASLACSLALVPGVRNCVEPLCSSASATLLGRLLRTLQPLPELVETLSKALVEEPPAILRDGGLIRDGHDPALDEFRAASRDGKDWIADLQEHEIARTGIKSLKVRFNSVFGYFIEITRANLSSAPSDYVRKQTTVNGERFVTPELKEMEGKILGSDEKAKAREIEIFQGLRQRTLADISSIQATAAAIAGLDALCSLAETARRHNFCRPEVDDSGSLEITEGRHPVLDQRMLAERFIPNDTALNVSEKRFAIITGPNMAGKSTYIRQIALLALMAQMGSYLPAASARIGVADRIFTRIGANDDLSKGQSTFMVEMNETANILNNATASSLVILDEIGRGTSTFDGLSIAWSVAEHLHDAIGCRTLFATHYHEMTDLGRTRSGIVNLNVAVREWNDEVIFLRKIVPGRADQSYGIQVARLAGLPDGVLHRAKEILNNLEKAELSADGAPRLAGGHDASTAFARTRRKKAAIRETLGQLDLL
jgi:DNA mismatch repair protein MutS